MPCGPACPPERCPGLRRCGRWRSSTNSSRIAADPTPARWATSTMAGTWTPASRCGRSSSAGNGLCPGRCRNRRRQRPGAGISGNAEQGPRAAEGDRAHRAAICGGLGTDWQAAADVPHQATQRMPACRQASDTREILECKKTRLLRRLRWLWVAVAGDRRPALGRRRRGPAFHLPQCRWKPPVLKPSCHAVGAMAAPTGPAVV